MKIHKSFLTHDGVSPNAAGKVIDLGFNGDFDLKKNEWNMIFIQFAGKESATSVTVTAYSKQSDISSIVASANAIGTLTIPADKAKKGGVFGVRMPKGLKRYFTLDITGTTLPDTITAGITDIVDTDTEFDWTNYKAANTGTSEVPEVREATTKDIADHAAITEGVHGLGNS
jgi:hypothetical protein